MPDGESIFHTPIRSLTSSTGEGAEGDGDETNEGNSEMCTQPRNA